MAFEVSRMICSTLREIRKAKNISQAELAEILEVDQQTIAKMEARKFSIGMDKFVQWMHALDVNIELHMKGDETPAIREAFEMLGRRPDSLPKN